MSLRQPKLAIMNPALYGHYLIDSSLKLFPPASLALPYKIAVAPVVQYVCVLFLQKDLSYRILLFFSGISPIFYIASLLYLL